MIDGPVLTTLLAPDCVEVRESASRPLGCSTLQLPYEACASLRRAFNTVELLVLRVNLAEPPVAAKR